MTLAGLIESRAGAQQVRRHLAGLTPAGRQQECLALTGTQQAALWRMAAGDDHQPEGELVAGASAIYRGRNSLRLFSHFEKWFSREGDRVIGCNRHPLSALIGPGYFSVEQHGAGELEFDYARVPAVAPEGWPPVRRNTGPLARLVYGDLLDRVVWLAPDVLVGAAFRRGAPLDSYFVVVRTL